MAQTLLSRTPQRQSRIQATDAKPLSHRTTLPENPERAHHEPDAFCVDHNLRSWASSRILSRGVDYYRKGRVLSLESYEDKRITARVEGTLEEPYPVEIRFNAQGMPVSKCACPFNWEPLCKHAVAVLLAWQQSETGCEPALAGFCAGSDAGPMDSDAREKYLQDLAAIERELRRGAALEQGLRIMDKPRHGLLGAYTVSSGNPNRGGSSYQVMVRDAQWEHASCQCLDFKTNELGTCKHIERLRQYLEAKPRARELARAAQRSPRISAYLGTRDSHQRMYSTAEHIRFHIPPAARPKAPAWLGEHVDAQGWLLKGHDAIETRAQMERLFQRLRSRTDAELDIDPRIAEVLRQEEEQLRWEERIAAIAKAPAQHRPWSDSVGRMRVQLHPYQIEGLLFAAKKRRAFIADDMGLGKTVQAIGTALFLKELGAANRVLVITPASLKFQWKQEIEKVSDASVDIIVGGAKSRGAQFKKNKAFFTLLNYELLYRDLDQILAFEPDMIILDEAQRIKNWETKIAQTIKRLRSPFRLVLTGTPLENRLPELLSIAEFLEPRALGAPWKLIPTYAEFDQEERIIGYARLDHLRERMSKFLIRRTRREVLSQLPTRTDNHYWTPITPEQADVHADYGRALSRLINKWKKFKRLTREDIQRMMMILTGMRIVCNAYGQHDWKPIELEVLTARRASPQLKKKIGSPKLEEFYKVMSELLENPGQKVVVFSQWERMLRLADVYIRDILEGLGARSVVFCGSLPLKKRAEEVKRFLEDPSTRVFFSTDAGGVGLNLQHGANCVVNLDVPWNPAVLEQRIGRVYRMGQKKSVSAIHFISSECVEQGIFGLVAQKKALFSGVFNQEAKEVRFTREQTASFVEKMKMIMPADAEAENSDEEDSETELDAKGAQTASEDSGTLQTEPPAADDSVAAVVPDQPGGVGMELDLAPLFRSLSGLISGAQQTAAQDRPAAAQGMKVRLSQDQEGVHVTLPKQAVDLLRGLAPLVAALAKLGNGTSPGSQ